jgi:predicted AAA+ superfamily ATPase
MLTETDLERIIAEWSFWDNPPPSNLSQRLIKLPPKLHSDIALVIQGVRRCGKSTLLMQIPGKYNLQLDNCFFCNFEDPRLMDNLDFNLLTQIVKLARRNKSTNTPCYFFFDEIQNVKEWEKWLHAQLERPKNNFFILTGSNSKLLSGEFASALTGRHITLELFPFSFAEYKLLFPERKLEDYTASGGFPRAITINNSYQLLQEYFNDIILRDVFRRVRARSPEAIQHVVKMVFESCGSDLSYRKIAAITSLTVDTVQTYLEACESAYLLFACHFFAFSEKKRLIREKKYYPIDSGLRLAVTNTRDRDLGKGLELMVYLKLRQTNEQVYYWKELHKGEVDFVTLNGNIITPYQVTWDEELPRHSKSLEYFYAEFPQAEEAVFITHNNAHNYL